MTFSPDGSKIASGSFDDRVRVWNVSTAKQLLSLDGHTFPVWSVAFSPDGCKIVSGSYDKSIRIWDAATGKQLSQLDDHTGAVFSPDGSKIVSGSADKSVRVWDVAAAQPSVIVHPIEDIDQLHHNGGSIIFSCV